MKELAEHFSISYQQAKDYSHHNKITVGVKEHTEHGCSREPLYTVWKGMIRRCYNETAKDYPRYGGRGIKVCTEWQNVEAFVEWCIYNGWKKGLQLDRKDNNKDYCPSNCRFVSRKENMNNRRNTIKFNGESLVSILEDKDRNPFNIERHTAWYRLKVLGWSLDKTLSTPQKGKEVKL